VASDVREVVGPLLASAVGVTGLIEVARTPSAFPWGERGKRPVRFNIGASAIHALQQESLPGLVSDLSRGTASCAWDLAPSIAKYTGLTTQLVQAAQAANGFLPSNSCPMPFPEAGERWWQTVGLPGARKHQITNVDFYARRAWAYCSDDPRTGKTFTAIATARRLDARHVLCIVPARAKLGWAREIARVTGESSLILEGRGANEMRSICLICGGRGYSTALLGETVARSRLTTITCKTCNGSGDSYYHIRSAGPVAPTEYDVESYLSATDGNGDPWPDGGEHLLEISVSLFPPVRPGCKSHRKPKQGAFNYCVACRAEFDQVFNSTRFIIANPEIFIKHKESTGEGRTVVRSDLPGWGGRYGPLWMKNWDLVFIDEAHNMRARNYESFFKTRTHRNDRIYDAIADARRVIALSGTPVFGSISDLYMQLNLISKGLFGEKNWDFDTRYCSPYVVKNPDGSESTTCKDPETGYWTPTGKTDQVAAELLPRQRTFMRRVTRAEANPDQAPITHTTEYLENPDAEKGARGLSLTKKEDVRKEIRRLSKLKHEDVVENVVQELMTGYKSYCLVYNVVEARQLSKLIEEAIESRELRGRMRALNAKVFLLTGETVKNAKLLEQICEDYRNHKGPACIVATYHQTQGFISLNGASFVHCVDWFDSALGMQQSIRRAYELFSEKLTVIYYVMRGTVDTRLERLVLPSLEAALAVTVAVKDTDLTDMKEALDSAASPGFKAAEGIEGASPTAAYVDAEGRLILPLTAEGVIERAVQKATGDGQRNLDNLFAQAPEGLDDDVFKLMLADVASIDENDTRNYTWGPGGAGGGGAANIDIPDEGEGDAGDDGDGDDDEN